MCSAPSQSPLSDGSSARLAHRPQVRDLRLRQSLPFAADVPGLRGRAVLLRARHGLLRRRAELLACVAAVYGWTDAPRQRRARPAVGQLPARGEGKELGGAWEPDRKSVV